MGLAGPRKRAKISHDPNNTQWTRSDSSFGKKILKSQGWKPGTLLGAQDAPHAEHHTDASASHIRVSLKDDTLGLGAKRGSGQEAGECTGLDVFQGLLGRLNGKSEVQLQNEQDSRMGFRRSTYVQNKWGSMTFVKAGLLVGDKVYGTDDAVPETEANRSKKSGNEGEEVPKDKTRSKKKAVTIEGESEVQSRKKKKRKGESGDPPAEAPRKRKRSKVDRIETVESKSPNREANVETRDEKRARKEAKRLRKAQKKAGRGSANKGETTAESSTPVEPEHAVPTTDVVSAESTALASPASGSNSPAPSALSSGRHAVRQRYIAQKRMALSDSKAMNEIFMIKA